MRNEEQALHQCPVCKTKVEAGQLGLQDFRWLDKVLPGRVGPADIDFILEQSRTGRVLIGEFKPKGAILGMGQRLLLKRFVTLGCDVWLVHELEDDRVKVGAMDRTGAVPFYERMTRHRLGQQVGAWWQAGFEDS